MDDDELNRRTDLPRALTGECKHGMTPAFCADCLGHKDADEEEEDTYRHWSQIANSSRDNNSRG